MHLGHDTRDISAMMSETWQAGQGNGHRFGIHSRSRQRAGWMPAIQLGPLP